MMGGDWIARYSAVWNAITNDAIQRDMLLCAAKFAHDMGEIGDRAIADVEWLLREARKVSEARNDAVHAPLISWGRPGQEMVRPEVEWGHPRARNLADKHLLSEFRWCRDSAVKLAEFCLHLELALQKNPGALSAAHGRVWPWPNRLVLPSRGQKKDRRDHGRQVLPKQRPRPLQP